MELSEFKLVDDRFTTVEEDDDNYETPRELFRELCIKYGIEPITDVCADSNNSKCVNWITKEENALLTEWNTTSKAPHDIWANPPGSLQLKFIERAESQYLKHNINILMIVPANCVSTEVWHRLIEDKREYHAVKGRPVFLKNGRKTKFPSRNSYVCIVWRRVSSTS